jgi:hypothetical protein
MPSTMEIRFLGKNVWYLFFYFLDRRRHVGVFGSIIWFRLFVLLVDSVHILLILAFLPAFYMGTAFLPCTNIHVA